MIINQLSPVVPERLSIWGDFWDKFGGIVLGGSLIAGGLLGAWATKKYFKKENQIYGYVGSAALGGFGAYKIYKSLKSEEVNPALPTDVFTVNILNPKPGEKWSVLLPHWVKAQIYNKYASDKKIFVGMSMLSEKSGQWTDFKVKEVVVDPTSLGKVSWGVWGRPDNKNSGVWYVVVAVWDKMPVPGGDATRLGEGESWVDYGIF